MQQAFRISNFTSDNLTLSESKNGQNSGVKPPTGGVQNGALSPEIEELLENALSPNTRKAYAKDIASFRDWGGNIPSSPEEIAHYIAERVNDLSIPTIKRHLSALAFIHETLDLPENPAKHALVRTAIKGASRLHKTPQRGVEPLLIEDLRRILDHPQTSARDAALLALGFAGGFRRSELAALNVEDIAEKPEGLVVTLRQSKTDQEGKGRLIGIPFARVKYCPARLTLDWMRELPGEGALFRPTRKGGAVLEGRLSEEAIAKIIKKAVQSISLDPTNYSGHSLRAGFVTSAIKHGAPSHLIRKQTGHASDTTMSRYIRLGGLFEENAAKWVF